MRHFLIASLLLLNALPSSASIIGLFLSSESTQLTLSARKDASGEVIFTIASKKTLTCEGQAPVDFQKRSHSVDSTALPDDLIDQVISGDQHLYIMLWNPRPCIEKYWSDKTSVTEGPISYEVTASELLAKNERAIGFYREGKFEVGFMFQQGQKGDYETHRAVASIKYAEIPTEDKVFYTWTFEDRSPTL